MAQVNGHRDGVPGAMLTPSKAEDAQILAAMDKLRELGIDQKYDLPQIIVCGSQSAGKSSVLESLVQVPFPSDEKTCTRYVTKVTMLHAETPSIQVRIQPGPDRKEAEAERLSGFVRQDSSSHYAAKLGAFMREAHLEIFKAKDAMITQDILQITVFGPGTRPLQVLDLPGLIAYDQKNLGNDAVIENMVTGYMAVKQSIILAVIKATEDLNNQKVLKLCETYDPNGERTLGIITRPDVAEEIQRRNLIAVMQGHDSEFTFKHRWHVLRNRSSQERETSEKDRDHKERLLLDGHPWNTVDKSCRGISELRARLRDLLFSLAKRELPGLCDTFHAKLGELEDEFNQLGGDEFGEGERDLAVAKSLSRLRVAARDHARGNYESDIRGFSFHSAVYLRARVADKSEVFRDRLVANGHTWKTLVRPTPTDPDSDLGSVYKEPEPESDNDTIKKGGIKIHESLRHEIDEAVQYLNQSRGQLLPGFFDPRRISNLFWKMSEGWNAIARDHIEQVYRCCERYFRQVTPVAFRREIGLPGFSNAQKVAGRFVGPYIVPRLDACRKGAWDELHRLELDRLDAPVNANLQFLKDRRSHRQGREFERAMRAHHEADGGSQKGGLDQTAYAQHTGLHTQRELTADTAETYLDAMWSHYLIERDIYITNVLKQVVERHFLRHISEIIPEALDLDVIEQLTQNDSVEEARKQDIKREMEVLRDSLRALEGIQ